MIFVTLGTQDKPFTRLLKDIDKQIELGNIKEKVIVQAGYTKYESKNMQIFDLLPKEDFDKYISECNLLITHGGVGSIITGLKNNKKVISAPRLFKYGEHMNDHQKQIIERFSEEGYIIPYNDGDDLAKVLKELPNFKANKYESKTTNIIKLIKWVMDND